MSYTWDGAEPPPRRRPGALGWARAALRGGALILVLAIAFPVLLLLRLPERAIWGLSRPVTPWITQGVCILACRILGLRRDVAGTPMTGAGAYVANHVSWLDIFVLNASKRLYFVAKAEVAGWAGIGWLARGTGTLFFARDPRRAPEQARDLAARLEAGHRLLFFPEGTSTDGKQVLAFRPTLFAAFFGRTNQDSIQVQPVSLRYDAPPGEAASFYGWWGDMSFGESLMAILSVPRQGSVRVRYHPPLAVRDFADRKALAAAAEAAVRAGVERGAGLSAGRR
ncbi:MAG: lysophospholipid acyltransferase family protein [Roseicyclus sp.]